MKKSNRTKRHRTSSTTSDVTIVMQINYPGLGNNSMLSYDGNDRRVAIIEAVSGTTISTKQIIRFGDNITEIRDASGSIKAQYFRYGQTISGASYLYAKDRLHSVRELTSQSGVIQAAYQYSPHGSATALVQNVTSDIQFARYYLHGPKQIRCGTSGGMFPGGNCSHCMRLYNVPPTYSAFLTRKNERQAGNYLQACDQSYLA